MIGINQLRWSCGATARRSTSSLDSLIIRRNDQAQRELIGSATIWRGRMRIVAGSRKGGIEEWLAACGSARMESALMLSLSAYLGISACGIGEVTLVLKSRILPAVTEALAIAGSARGQVSPALNLTYGSSDRGVASSVGQGGESMMGIKQLRLSSAQPRVAQPHR